VSVRVCMCVSLFTLLLAHGWSPAFKRNPLMMTRNSLGLPPRFLCNNLSLSLCARLCACECACVWSDEHPCSRQLPKGCREAAPKLPRSFPEAA
jgi:hypothetical protein